MLLSCYFNLATVSESLIGIKVAMLFVSLVRKVGIRATVLHFAFVIDTKVFLLL